MTKLKTYFNNHPKIKKSLSGLWKLCCIILIITSVAFAYEISDWIASWCMKNIFGVPYSSLGKERTAIFGFIKYYLPAIFFIILSMILSKPKKGLEMMGLLIHFKWRHLIAIALTVPLLFGLLYFSICLKREFLNNFDYLTWHVGWGWHYISQTSNDWGHIVFSVACAPVGEEIMFRGWLYGRLRNIVPYKWFIPIAIIITSVCFGWIHNNFQSAVLAFCFSVSLCLLREYTGNIYGGIIIHSLWNLQTYYPSWWQ